MFKVRKQTKEKRTGIINVTQLPLIAKLYIPQKPLELIKIVAYVVICIKHKLFNPIFVYGKREAGILPTHII